MKYKFADRMSHIPPSFVREILKVTESPEIISFAGGLPHPVSFPVEKIKKASHDVLSRYGKEVLQYSTTEGHLPLREYIAGRYASQGLRIDADEILITNGSQQCLDLVGKVFLDKNDRVLLEKPTYLAAIQSFSLYEPIFKSVPLEDDGPDMDYLEDILLQNKIKLYYAIPNFQNPTGISYSLEKRKKIAGLLSEGDTVLVEDNPYGDIRFRGTDIPPIKSFHEEGILFGSFSKIVSPGMRLGWIVAEEEIMEKLVIAKQASDLHSNYFTQRVVCQFLEDNDLKDHISTIKKSYYEQCQLMLSLMDEYFPEGVTYTRPEGGMFLWVTLPSGISSRELFDLALKDKVAFVPGEAFYTGGEVDNTFRLNFSNSNNEKIEEGIKRLARAIKKLMI
ncbi:PLP-dependent aminotransferase family protein [Methanobacterium alkalithermotolerans]|uniref:PLP-dependent aminotransferase family protein n=1 Tax=Methanobacterium alkalithermotolerans TaxID=2731220 RepID=A0A8T8K772_9EURY|nr:PLP-dependent aminotransferase family protein [Methanobacterium alkalithermotolerans]QUH23877.1 PLP-dependent aminotransferase family protein [Methanobacterium alkalithermotolerans]